MTAKRASVLERFRGWRARRKHDRHERNVRSRENLRDYKQTSGYEPF
jgi:hypothetical protein